jgi:hypothetical protein
MSYREVPVSELATDVGQTIRYPSNSILTINSRDRYLTVAQKATNPTTPYNFTVTKSESLFNGFFTRIGLTEVNFPFLLPNINARSNSIFVQIASSVGPAVQSTTILLSYGFKNPADIAGQLETALDTWIASLGAPFTNVQTTVKYSGQYGITFNGTYVAPFSFLIVLDNTAGAGTVSLTLSQDPTKLNFNNLYSLMGFPGITTGLAIVAAPASYSATFSGAPTSCAFTSYVDIVSRRLVAYQNLYDTTSSAINRNLICRLYINTDNNTLPTSVYDSADDSNVVVPAIAPGTFASYIYRQFRNPKMLKYDSEVPIGQLDFVIYDDLGNPYDESIAATYGTTQSFNMPDYQMTFLVSEN